MVVRLRIPAERLRGLGVNDDVEFRRLPIWSVSRPFALEDATGMICATAEQMDAAAARLHAGNRVRADNSFRAFYCIDLRQSFL
jgi:hypothetical protein